MAKTFEWFIAKELLIKDRTIKNLAKSYLDKARSNIVTMELLSKVIDFRNILELPDDYDPNEWVVITGYYSMYMAALAVLAKIGFKSKNHSATSISLEEFFVKKKLLEKEYVESLERVKLKKEEIEALDKVRDQREIAQYSVTKKTTKSIADETKKDAHRFVNRMEELFDSI